MKKNCPWVFSFPGARFQNVFAELSTLFVLKLRVIRFLRLLFAVTPIHSVSECLGCARARKRKKERKGKEKGESTPCRVERTRKQGRWERGKGLAAAAPCSCAVKYKVRTYVHSMWPLSWQGKAWQRSAQSFFCFPHLAAERFDCK